MALLSGSPAIDKGNDTVCAASPVNNLDQRGVTRPQGKTLRIGPRIGYHPNSDGQIKPPDNRPNVTSPIHFTTISTNRSIPLLSPPRM